MYELPAHVLSATTAKLLTAACARTSAIIERADVAAVHVTADLLLLQGVV